MITTTRIDSSSAGNKVTASVGYGISGMRHLVCSMNSAQPRVVSNQVFIRAWMNRTRAKITAPAGVS
jgi:hypothetical protein